MIDVLVAATSLPFAAAGAYLATLTAASRRGSAPAGVVGPTFDVLVPAHNEERGIAATVASLQAMEYAPARYRVIVIADNCSDATAARARDAGAMVLERADPTRRGKGYALAFGIDRCLRDGIADHVAVVDADTLVSRNFLSAAAARFAAGAECVQVAYGVRNPDDSWRTRLMRLAFTLHHVVRSLGRERLGLSCGLRGNGMAFSSSLLRRVPYRAFSIVEDVEYGLVLALHGTRIHYVAEAAVAGEMPPTAEGAAAQRRRWELGRAALISTHLGRLIGAAVRGNALAFDVAADLLVPPLALLGGGVALGTAVSIALAASGSAGWLAASGWLVASAGLALYAARGWQLSDVGVRGLRDVLWLPVYVVWKVAVLLRGTPSQEAASSWVRTRRAGEPISRRAPLPPLPSKRP